MAKSFFCGDCGQRLNASVTYLDGAALKEILLAVHRRDDGCDGIDGALEQALYDLNDEPATGHYTLQSVDVHDIDKVAQSNHQNGGWRLHSWHPDPQHEARILVLWVRDNDGDVR